MAMGGSITETTAARLWYAPSSSSPSSQGGADRAVKPRRSTVSNRAKPILSHSEGRLAPRMER